jgi:hypothetical protein
MKMVPNAPAASSSTATSATERGPLRSIQRPTMGPEKPKSKRLIETAMVMEARSQPNSCSKGMINTPGMERMPAEESMAMNMAATTTQP